MKGWVFGGCHCDEDEGGDANHPGLKRLGGPCLCLRERGLGNADRRINKLS